MTSVPILINIINQIKTIIPLMTIANGYQYNHGSVNQYDPASRTYPASFLEFPDEEGADEDEEVIERYVTNTQLNIRTIVPTSANLDQDIQNVISDFGLMFHSNLATLQTKGLIVPDYLGSSVIYTLCTAYPAETITRWNLKYRRQKSDPYST